MRVPNSICSSPHPAADITHCSVRNRAEFNQLEVKAALQVIACDCYGDGRFVVSIGDGGYYCSLDTVSAFRAQVRRNASKNIFDQLKWHEMQQPVPSKGCEFPQHLRPEKRGRRGRHQRHKTLPVTAEELNAIPEGELLEPLPLRDLHELWKRDSRTDSGILSGSDAESLGSDSLRSLSLEMDTSDNDPSRMSVSSKTSLFKSLDERARQDREKEKSASGAKRYIDRKKRERSRTQPVTDDEVKTAAEMSDDKKSSTTRLPQPEVVNRARSPSVDQEAAEQEEDDQLTK